VNRQKKQAGEAESGGRKAGTDAIIKTRVRIGDESERNQTALFRPYYTMLPAKVNQFYLAAAVNLRLQDADIRQVAVHPRVVQPVANHKLVFHLKAAVIHRQIHPPPRRLV